MAVVRQDTVKIDFDIEMKELTKMRDELDEIKKMLGGGLGDDALDEFIRDSKKASEGTDELKDSIDDIKPDGIEDTVKGLKKTDDSAEDAKKELKKLGNTSFDKTISGLKKIGSALGSIAVKAGKVLAKGIAVGAAAVAAVVGKSVSEYANYEQLVGGVETLFGTGSQSNAAEVVIGNANEAFRTAGLSANEYMETVTSFSASMISGLGGDTAKAAQYADMAIVDMADNANKMGTDMASIQDAYQGFAKQNYTMLDNLKLGYGGTKTEMERLLKDAEAITGKKFDINNFADVVEAIHVIQTEMGITGTTAEEASSTISGSFASMKAAAMNTLTALVLGGDDLDKCIDNLVDSAKTFGKNVIPAVTKALQGFGKLIEEVAPIVEKEIPTLIETLLPPLIKAATSLVKGIIAALPDIIKTLAKEIPGVLSELWGAFKEAFGNVPGFDKVENFFGKLKELFEKNSDTIKKLVPVIIGMVAAFKLLKKLKFLGGLFGGKGGGGGGIFSGFQSLAKLKVSSVLKGMLNLTIILGGLVGLAAALMWAAPYIAQLSDLQSIGKLLLVLSAVGLIGSAMAKLAGYVGNIPVATVAKGLADIAIIMVGLGALAFVLGWASSAFTFDIAEMVKLLAIIGVVGLLGSALAGLAGLIGAIPIPVVLAGLANIALALGGITAIIEAFGLLSEIPGFSEFLTKGGEVLAEICRIIGEMAGSLIGGIGEGITNSLPAIGENISAFAAALEPAMTTFSGMNFDGISKFASAFGTLVLALTGEKITSWFTGGIDYAKIGTDLSALTTNSAGFFEAVQNIPEAAFTAATNLFTCLNGIGMLPNSGGVVQWFTGEVDYAGIATGLASLATTTGFFTAVQSIPEDAFTAATNLFNCLNGIGSLPKSGGLAQWFTGEVDYQSIADGLAILGGSGMIAALTAITGIPAEAYSSLTALFDALAGIKQMPKEGGIFGWFTGDSSSGLTNVSTQLPTVAENIATFFSNLGGITDFTPIADLFNTLSNIEINTDVADKGFWSGVSSLGSMGTGLNDFAKNAATFFDTIKTVDASAISSFFDAIGECGDLTTKLEGVDGTIGTTLTNIVTTVNTGMTSIQTSITTNIDGIVSAINSKQFSFFTSGVAIMQGLNNGIKSMRSTLISTAQGIADSIRTTINSAMQVNSPSKVTFKTGTFVGQGLALGMESTLPEIKGAAMSMSYAATPFDSYTPESSVTTYNNDGDSSYTTVSPVFNLTISGSQDDSVLARKVKRYVSEAIKETFASLDRKVGVVREV